MSGMCGTLSGESAAYQTVESQIGVMQTYAANAYNTALGAINQLSAFEVDDVNVNANFYVPSLTVTVEKPERPEATISPFSLTESVPSAPSLIDIGSLPTTAVPTFNEAAPLITLPSKPAALNIIYPDSPSNPATPVYPDDPDISYPSVPTMRELNIPAMATIDLSTLQGEFATLRSLRPSLTPDLIDGLTESITSDTYAQYINIKSRLDSFVADNPSFALNRTRLGELLSGGSTGLPSAVEAQLRGRAFQAVDDQYAQDLGRVLYEWSAKGHTTNDGVLIGQLTDLRNAARNKKAELNRDIYVQAAEWEIKNLQFAVQQGIAWEGAYRQSCATSISLAKDMAVNLFQAAESIYKAKVSLYELQLKVFQTDVAAFESWLKIELADLEVYKAQLDAARLTNEINAQDVEIYKARLAAVSTEVEVFKSRIEAVNSRIQADAQRVELYKAQLQACGIQADIYKSEWQGYGEAVKGEVGRADVYESLARAFSERVKAYATEIDAAKAFEGFKLEQNKLFIESFKADLERFKTLLQKETSRISGDTAVLESLVKLYDSDVRLEGVKAEVGNRQFQLELEEGKARAELELKKADLNINQVQREAQLELGALDSISRVGAQLAGSAMSAMSVQANISSSLQRQDSTICQTQYEIKVES